MKNYQIQTIDDVIGALDRIICDSENKSSPLGYFAALYRKVTIKVKEGIENNYFDDGERMEKMDVIFAKRYLDAYNLWIENSKVNKSWQVAFEHSNDFWPIVLQHLLLGMNAHINLDLGIAAAEVSKNKDINDLENDFNRINEILSLLVNEVQNNLTDIWPLLQKILQKTKKVDDFMIDFSMELARDGAWEFAKIFSGTPANNIEKLIRERDEKIAKKNGIITNPGFPAKLILMMIRLGERGTVSEKIRKLISG